LEVVENNRLAVAKLRPGNFLKGENHRAEIVQSEARGKMTFGDAIVLYKQRLDNAQHLKPRAKEYRQSTIGARLKTWPGLKETDVRNITAMNAPNRRQVFGRSIAPQSSLYTSALHSHQFLLDQSGGQNLCGGGASQALLTSNRKLMAI
jgi:hypothetical protein